MTVTVMKFAPHPYPLPVKDGERGTPTSRPPFLGRAWLEGCESAPRAMPPSPRPSRGEGKGEGRVHAMLRGPA